MTIEFNCPSCSKVLKTADNKAGLSAKCPGCGHVLVVPGSSGAAGSSPAAGESWSAAEPEGGGDATADEFAAAPARKTRPCPMCGQEILEVARVCRHCGERFNSGSPSIKGGRFEPTQIDAGEVLNIAWGTFKENMGMAIVGFIIPGLITLVAYGIFEVANQAILFSAQQGGGNPNTVLLTLLAFQYGFRMPVDFVLRIFLALGQAIFFLKLCRGEQPVVGDLFAGGRFMLRGLGAGILVFLMVMVGVLAACVGSIIAALVTAPYLYYLTDRDEGVFDTLNGTIKLTWPNLGPVFLLALASAGIVLAGLLALCFGVIIAAPFTIVISATSYLMMSGQISTRSQS